MGKFTPGPWAVHPDEGGFIIGPDKKPVAFAAASRMTADDAEGRGPASANTRLIAAAPDLLALSDLVTVYQIEGDDAVHINVCGVKIGAFGQSTHRAAALLRYEADRRAAIAKATGEATP